MYEALCCAVCREPIPATRDPIGEVLRPEMQEQGALTLERHAERLRRKLDADRIIQAHELWFAIFTALMNRHPRQAATSSGCGPGSRRTGFRRCARVRSIAIRCADAGRNTRSSR